MRTVVAAAAAEIQEIPPLRREDVAHPFLRPGRRKRVGRHAIADGLDQGTVEDRPLRRREQAAHEGAQLIDDRHGRGGAFHVRHASTCKFVARPSGCCFGTKHSTRVAGSFVLGRRSATGLFPIRNGVPSLAPTVLP